MVAVQILREDPCSLDFKPLEAALRAWEIRRSDPKNSHRLALELIDHALEFDDPLVTAWAYLTCGAHELAANEFEQAEESLESAIKLFTRTGEKRGESLAIVLRARVCMGRGEFHPALEMYKSIIEREANGLQTLERFEAFNAIAGCFWGLDNVELCLLYLSKAFDTLRNTPHNTERATILSNMGAALVAVGNYEAAREFLIAAIKFSEKSGDRVLGLNIFLNLVACHIELKEVPEAIAVSTRMLAEYQDLAFAGPSNTVLCNAAMAFALGKQWTLANQCLVGAQVIAEESGLPMSKLLVAQTEATIAEARGNHAVAAAHAEAILENFAEQLSNEAKSQIYGLLVICYQHLSRLDDMLAMRKRRLSLSESRYSAGLAAAMVILDLKASLKHLPN
jgi:tetratricopeptide (TPR) repeat protein